jgi:hypothetical protein
MLPHHWAFRIDGLSSSCARGDGRPRGKAQIRDRVHLGEDGLPFNQFELAAFRGAK